MLVCYRLREGQAAVVSVALSGSIMVELCRGGQRKDTQSATDALSPEFS